MSPDEATREWILIPVREGAGALGARPLMRKQGFGERVTPK